MLNHSDQFCHSVAPSLKCFKRHDWGVQGAASWELPSWQLCFPSSAVPFGALHMSKIIIINLTYLLVRFLPPMTGRTSLRGYPFRRLLEMPLSPAQLVLLSWLTPKSEMRTIIDCYWTLATFIFVCTVQLDHIVDKPFVYPTIEPNEVPFSLHPTNCHTKLKCDAEAPENIIR